MKVPPLYYHLKCNTSTVDVTSVCFHLVNSQSPLFGFEKSSPLTQARYKEHIHDLVLSTQFFSKCTDGIARL